MPSQGRHALSLCAAMRAHQDRRGGAEAGQGASAASMCASRRRSPAFTQDADGVTASRARTRRARRKTISGRYMVSGEGARSIVRKDLDIEFEGFTYPDRTLNIEVAYDFRAARLYRPQLHFRSRRMVEPVSLERPAGPLARAFPDRARRRRGGADRVPRRCRRGCRASCRPASASISSAAISTPCISGWRRNSASAARSSPAIPRT